MFIEQTHIASTPLSESWTSWVLLVLLLLFVAAIVRQPALISRSFNALFTKLQRSYSDAAGDILTDAVLLLFRVGTLALALYVMAYRSENFSVLYYLLLVGIILLAKGVKWLLIKLTTYIFSIRHGVEEAASSCDAIGVLFAIVLYPLTLLMVDFDWVMTGRVVTLLLFSTCLVLETIKLIRVFTTKPMSLVYIAMYLMTLEILPVCALVDWVHLTA